MISAIKSTADIIENLNQFFAGENQIISDVKIEPESKEYHACRFLLVQKRIVFRTAKITPKKAGQFVTCWKRNSNGPIEPFHKDDPFDFFMVQVNDDKQCGYFIFPKQVLLDNKIISSSQSEGKRAFRIYPPWANSLNSQASKTQAWQLSHFYKLESILSGFKLLQNS